MNTTQPKKILYFSVTSRLGGGERVLLQIIDNLNRATYTPIVILPGPGPMEQELKKRGIKFGIISNNIKYSKFWPFPFIWQIFKILFWMIKEDVSLVHANDLEVFRASGIAASILKRKIVCHLHTPPTLEELRYAFICKPDTVIGCCEDMTKNVHRFLPPVPRKTSVRFVLNSINVENYRPRQIDEIHAIKQSLKLDQNDFVITTIGDLSERKGVSYFLQMAQGVLNQQPNVQFLIIGKEKKGDEGYEKVLRHMAKDLGVGDRVQFVGFTDRVADYLALSDIFVLPSLSEGLPLVILEAMACGKPVVATNVNGIPELIQEGVTGFMVGPRDAFGLTTLVLRLLKDQTLREHMGIKGRKRVEQFFNLPRYMQQMEALYSDIIKNDINAVVRHRRLTHFLAYTIQKLFYRRQKIADRANIKKILVVLLDFIGDSLLSSSIFPVLKENFPNASITVMAGAWTQDLYKAHPSVERVVVYNCNWLNRTGVRMTSKEKMQILRDLHRERFDLIVDIRGSLGTLLLGLWRSSRYRVDQRVDLAQQFVVKWKMKLAGQYRPVAEESRVSASVNVLKPLGITVDQLRTAMYIPDEDRAAIKDVLKKEGIDINRGVISLHPGVNSRFKRWDAKRWAELADHLIEGYHLDVVISGGKSDAAFNQDIVKHMKHQAFDLTGKMTLMQMAALIEISRACVCLDSGPMHIAGVLNVPVVALFGPNHPDTCAPQTNNGQWIYHKLSCSASCTESEEMGCDAECMKAITVQEVVERFRKFDALVRR